jgi:hypothetical protein
MLVTILALLLRLLAALDRSIWLRRTLLAPVLRFGLHQHAPGYRRTLLLARAVVRTPAKPPWVKREIIRLKSAKSAPAGMFTVGGADAMLRALDDRLTAVAAFGAARRSLH